MISPQPIRLIKYLGFKRNKLPVNLRRLFYLSYEDALWDILKKKNIKPGSIILVPDFFCRDVETNIERHGYKIAGYKMASGLTINTADFKDKIKFYKPKNVF
jgi:hypothetical protein